MSTDLPCWVREAQEVETFVLEDSISCPHFTDKETEALQSYALLRDHPAQQGRTQLPALGTFCPGGSQYLRPVSAES